MAATRPDLGLLGIKGCAKPWEERHICDTPFWLTAFPHRPTDSHWHSHRVDVVCALRLMSNLFISFDES